MKPAIKIERPRPIAPEVRLDIYLLVNSFFNSRKDSIQSAYGPDVNTRKAPGNTS